MSAPTNHEIRITRVIRAPRERLYKALLDPDALAKWLPPSGFTAKVHKLEPRAGGTFRISFTSIDTGETHSFGGTYRELVPNERIRHTDAFETNDPAMKGEMTMTITLREVPEGTEVAVVQEGIPRIIPVESARVGWTSSLTNLANLVEVPEMSAAARASGGMMVALPSDHEIRIERVFHAPSDRVWRAFTDPKLVAQWWGRGNKLVIERLEVKRGGHWRFVEHGPDGVHGFEGRFREVAPPERIVQTFEWDGMPGYVVINIATFEDLGDGRTKVVTTALFHTAEELDGMLQSGMEQGLSQSYAALDRVLASLSGT